VLQIERGNENNVYMLKFNNVTHIFGLNIYMFFLILVYSQADSDEFGYIIRQTDIYYGNGTAELTCFISKKTFPLQWKKIDPHGVYDPIEISYGQKLIINDSRFSLRIHGTDLLYSIKVT